MMKLKTLALATSIALSAMSVAGPAQAGALATSVLDITGFTISRGGVILDSKTDFSLLTPANTADISASLNGVTVTGAKSGTGEDLDIPHVTVGVPVPAYVENSYSVYSNPPMSSFALSDQSQIGSPISGLIDPNTGLAVGTPASASHAAYVSLDAPGDGSSTANNGLQAGFIFALDHGGAVDFKFDARAYLEAFTNPGAAFPTASSAAYGLTFTIDNLTGGGANVVTWTPDGLSNPGSAGAFGLTSETDPFKLNDSLSRSAPFNGTSFRGASEGTAFFGSWSGTTVGLLANNAYQLTIRSHAEADARKVPEPATLALMGLGLLGLGLSRRRRA